MLSPGTAVGVLIAIAFAANISSVNVAVTLDEELDRVEADVRSDFLINKLLPDLLRTDLADDDICNAAGTIPDVVHAKAAIVLEETLHVMYLFIGAPLGVCIQVPPAFLVSESRVSAVL